MSNPALIVVREGRRRTVALQRFGAPFLVPALFAGPACLEQLLAEGDASKLTHDEAVDAAVVVDVGRRALGVVARSLDAMHAPTAMRLLGAAWPGFRVEFALRLSGLSRLVGVDLVKRAVTSASRPKYFEPTRNYARLRMGGDAFARLGRDYRELVREMETWSRPHRSDFGFAGVLSVRTRGEVVTRLSDASLGWLFFEGPALLEHVDALPTLEEASALLAMQRRVRVDDGRWTHLVGYFPVVHLFIDADEKFVRVTADDEGAGLSDYSQAHLAAQAWPGFRVEVVFGSVETHFAGAGAACPRWFRGDARALSEAATVRELDRMIRAHEGKLREAQVFLGRVPEVMHGFVSELVEEHPGSEIIVRASSPDPRAPVSDASAIVRGWTAALAAHPELARAAAAMGEGPEAVEHVRTAMNKLRSFQPDAAGAKRALAEVEAMRASASNASASDASARDADVWRVARGIRLALALEEESSSTEAGLAVIAEAARAYEEDAAGDAWLVAIRAGLPPPWNLEELERSLDLEANPRVAMWLASAWLGRAEAEPLATRGESLGRALSASARSAHRTWFIAWCDACAHSLAERDRAAVQAAFDEALSLHAEPAKLEKKMRVDPQLAWFFASEP